MERNFPVIPIFRNFRPTSRGTPKFRNEILENVCSIHSQPGISGIFGRMESALSIVFTSAPESCDVIGSRDGDGWRV